MNKEQLERVMDDSTQYLLRIGYYYTKDIEKFKDFVQDVFITRNEKIRCHGALTSSWHFRRLIVAQ